MVRLCREIGIERIREIERTMTHEVPLHILFLAYIYFNFKADIRTSDKMDLFEQMLYFHQAWGNP